MHLAHRRLRRPSGSALRDALRSGRLSPDCFYRQLISALLRHALLHRYGPEAAVCATHLSSTATADEPGALDVAVGDDHVAHPCLLGEHETIGALYESLLSLQPAIEPATLEFTLTPSRRSQRWDSGAFYTPAPLVERLLAAALDPELDAACRQPDPWHGLLRLTFCDPACGCGVILVAALDRLADRLVAAGAGSGDPDACPHAEAARCVYGVDSDPIAVDLCRVALWDAAGRDPAVARLLAQHIRCADALRDVGAVPGLLSPVTFGAAGSEPPHGGVPALAPVPSPAAALDDERRFDVILGNPPWTSYSGRQRGAADHSAVRALVATHPSIARWPCTHAAFLAAAPAWLRPGGRLGFLLPYQVAYLPAFAPVLDHVSRAAGAAVEAVSLGEAVIRGVCQEVGAFSLTAARARLQAPTATADPPRLQPVVRNCDSGLEAVGPEGLRGGQPPAPPAGGLPARLAAAMREALSRCPPFPAAAFGDPGVHTGNMAARLVHAAGADLPALREGRDIAAFRCLPPGKTLDPSIRPGAGEYCRIGPQERYMEVPILLRQTADRPIACLHNEPAYFRNSILACAGAPGWPDAAIAALLNSCVLAWWFRQLAPEASQRSFPQVKVGALQKLALPPLDSRRARSLAAQAADICLQLTAIVAGAGDRIAEDAGAQPMEPSSQVALLARMERVVLALYGLPEELAEPLLAAQPAPGRRRRALLHAA